MYELTHTVVCHIVVRGCTCRLIPSAGKATQTTDVVEQPQDEAAHSLCCSLPHLRHISHIVQRIQVHKVGGDDSHKHEPQCHGCLRMCECVYSVTHLIKTLEILKLSTQIQRHRQRRWQYQLKYTQSIRREAAKKPHPRHRLVVPSHPVCHRAPRNSILAPHSCSPETSSASPYSLEKWLRRRQSQRL